MCYSLKGLKVYMLFKERNVGLLYTLKLVTTKQFAQIAVGSTPKPIVINY